jgi:signal transduction histidine kinase
VPGIVIKGWVKRHWPRLRLRTILFSTLFFVAALPGVGAVFLRVYENTLVRQTEGELVAQAAALSATAAALWPGAPPLRSPDPADLRPEPPSIDLNATPILPERPAPAASGPLAPDALVAARRLDPIFARTRRTTLAAIVLLDVRGRVATGPEAGGGHAALPEFRRALAGRPATVLRRNAGYRAVYRFEWLSRAAAIRVHHARPVTVGGRVVGVLLLSRSSRALFRGLYEDRGKIAVAVLAILLALVALSGVLSRGIARPIEALGRATRAVAGGHGRVPDAPSTAAVEIQDLYRDFAVMAEAIGRRSRYLRDFAHAVSHEFKTPLAGIRGALELLGDHGEEMTPAERARFLANAGADADRLTLLVSRLLDLARADMAEPDGRESVDARPVLARVADAYRSDLLGIELDLPPSMPRLAVPAATLETVLGTLFENSRQAGATRVTVTAEPLSMSTHSIRIADNGPGIAPADRERVFEPFFTTRRASGGTGLGLPIVRSLLDAAGARIGLEEEPDGTAFLLCLPARPEQAVSARPS